MSTITVILEADADGTLHLPLPAELRHGKIEVTATLKAVNATSSVLRNAAVARRISALEELRGWADCAMSFPIPRRGSVKYEGLKLINPFDV